MLGYYITSFGLVPYFSARAFVPLFASAMVARFAPSWEGLADLPGVQLLSHTPGWASSNTALGILFLLALMEVLSSKSPELRELFTLFDSKIKGVAVFLVCFALIQGDPMQLLGHVEKVGLTTNFAFGQSFEYIWAFGIATLVWFTAALRNLVFGSLADLDPDDDLGLQGLLSWVEDGIGFLGVLFVVILPVLSLGVVGVTLFTLFLARKYLEYLEKRSQVPCSSCGAPGSPCGLVCPSCGEERPDTRQVGLLSRVKEDLVTDREGHKMALRTQKRCPSCGDRLKQRRLAQCCQRCEEQPFSSRKEVETYLQALHSKLPRVLTVLMVLSFVPVLGLIPGVLYYRLSIISSLRAYLPRSTGFFGRWLVRVGNFLLIVLQPVPLLGAVTLPLMCLTNYGVYRSLLRSRMRKEFEVNDRGVISPPRILASGA